MTLHSWQQTKNSVTRKFGENVAIKVLLLEMAESRIFYELFYDILFNERKLAFMAQNLLELTCNSTVLVRLFAGS